MFLNLFGEFLVLNLKRLKLVDLDLFGKRFWLVFTGEGFERRGLAFVGV